MDLRSRVQESIQESPISPQNPLRNYGDFLRAFFGGPIQKISLNTSFGCPNRQKGLQGCKWCAPASFLPQYCLKTEDLDQQLSAGIQFFSRKQKDARFLAFFQGYTSSWEETEVLKGLCEKVLARGELVGLIFSTRPDALEARFLDLLAEYSQKHFVCLELGLESFNGRSLDAMNRGHDPEACFKALEAVKAAGIPAGLHLIMGLPGDSREEMSAWPQLISQLPVHFLKLHHLQVLRSTELAGLYNKEPFPLFAYEDYLAFCEDFVQNLSPHIILERFTNEAPLKDIVAPHWGGIKNQAFTKELINRMKAHNTWQGKKYAV